MKKKVYVLLSSVLLAVVFMTSGYGFWQKELAISGRVKIEEQNTEQYDNKADGGASLNKQSSENLDATTVDEPNSSAEETKEFVLEEDENDVESELQVEELQEEFSEGDIDDNTVDSVGDRRDSVDQSALITETGGED